MIAWLELKAFCVLNWLRRYIARPIFGWVVALAPLWLIACYYLAPTLLEGLVLLRLADQSEFRGDIFFVTLCSMLVTTFGIAIIRMFDLYSQLRFENKIQEVVLFQPNESRQIDIWWWNSNSTGWPISVMIGSVIPTGGLLAFMWWRTQASLEGVTTITHYVPKVTDLVMMTGAGLFIAAASVLTLSLLQVTFWRKRVSMCGLLPLEDVAAICLEKAFGKVQINANQVAWLKWFHPSPGFTGQDRHILPGHLQLGFMISLGLMAYVWLYYQFDHADGIRRLEIDFFPVVVYALLLTYLIGGVFASVTFFLGRYRVPLWLFLGLLAVSIYMIGGQLGYDSNRYFPLLAERKPTTALSNPIDESTQLQKSTFEMAIESGRGVDGKPADRLTLREVYANWHFPKDSKGKRTMVVVTASGGGIQASAWTAKVLSNMDRHFPTFSESIGLVSAVSGGSVGSMYYLGHRGHRANVSDSAEGQSTQYLRLTDEQRQRIEQCSAQPSLEAIGWGLCFPDFFRNLAPFPDYFVGRENDRSVALESTWWPRMAAVNATTTQVAKYRDLRIKDLVKATNAGFVPPMIFNTTSVETGQRVMISTFISNKEVQSSDPRLAVSFARPIEPIDFFEFYEPLFLDKSEVDPRVTTAVRLSATFAYVTPVARPLIDPNRLSDLSKSPELANRLNYHLCDGGYSDNTGMVAAIQVIRSLLDDYRRHSQTPPFEQILFFSIESFPGQDTTVDNDALGLSSGYAGPLNAIFNARVSSQAERARLEQSLLIRSGNLSFDSLSDEEKFEVFDIDEFQRLQSAASSLTETLKSKDEAAELRTQIGRIEQIANRANSTLNNLSSNNQRGSKVKVTRGDAAQMKNLARATHEQSSDFELTLKTHLDDQELALLKQLIASATKLVELTPPSEPEEQKQLAITGYESRFDPSRGPAIKSTTDSPPLSWTLSRRDLQRIHDAWQRQEDLLVTKERIKQASVDAPLVASSSQHESPSAPPSPQSGIRTIDDLGSILRYEPRAEN